MNEKKVHRHAPLLTMEGTHNEQDTIGSEKERRVYDPNSKLTNAPCNNNKLT